MNTTEPARETILVVDDAPDNITLLTEILDPYYRVKVAINGAGALKAAAATPPPDLILLDVMMPEMDGYEVCRRLKDDVKTRNIPVIFVTAKVESEDEVHGLVLGAVDYVSKPVRAAVVLARIRTHLALKRARAELEGLNLTLQQEKEVLSLARAQLAELNLTLQREKEVVESIVAMMHGTAAFDRRSVRSHLTSVDRTAGDMVFSAYRPDGTQHVMVGDFSGHGLPAAVAGPLVSYIFYALTALGRPLFAILAEINSTLQRQLPAQIYMASSAVEIAPDRQSANFWNNGLPRTMIIRQGEVRLRIESSEMPLGIIDPIDDKPSAANVPMNPDDFIYLYTDGMNEITSPAGEEFGIPRLEKLLAPLTLSRAPLDSLWGALIAHRGGTDFPDDATLMEVSMQRS